MKLDESIRSKFVSPTHKAVVNILFTNNWIRDKQSQIFKQHDLLPQHFNVLRIIAGKHPETVSPGEIKEVMIDKGADVTRLLEKLEKKGLLERRICKSNRRMIDIHINSKGIKLADELGQKLKIEMADIDSNITQEEADQLSNLLDKMRG